MTYFSRFEDIYLRFAVYIIGDKISKTYQTGFYLSENYLANMNRVFFGEQHLIENIENDREVFIIFEIINITNQNGVKSMELVGWTLLRPFDDHEGFIQKQWVIPIFQPPVQYSVRPKQAVDNLYYLEGTKLFLRMCVPRNKKLNFELKKPDPISGDYSSSPDYILVMAV
jgi:hypothetical protein